ncbi:MAG TPA: PQQ-binding-like beta-propeller repeat protein, partial [Bryobacterales bacterium]|nr:PQQ-binding-like beta-propeller repeat protein [Bryobacterales bacterium]
MFRRLFFAASLCFSMQLAVPPPSAAQEWKVYGGDLSSTRFSPLNQINTSNVNRLTVNWVFQTGVPGKFEATPLFENGILYFTGPGGYAWAVDARTGRALWNFERPIPSKIGLCCGPVNRGFALAGNRLITVTIDAHVIALDKRTGALLWDTTMADYTKGYSATAAPLLVKDKVIVGMAGAEFANRGFIDAYSVATGERAWRFWTIPSPGEPGSETWKDG